MSARRRDRVAAAGAAAAFSGRASFRAGRHLDLRGRALVPRGAVSPARPRFLPCHTRLLGGVPESLDVLGEREFRLLWLGRSLSSIGDALVPVAAAFAVLEIGTATDLGIVLGASMGGRLVFMLVGGVWAA